MSGLQTQTGGLWPRPHTPSWPLTWAWWSTRSGWRPPRAQAPAWSCRCVGVRLVRATVLAAGGEAERRLTGQELRGIEADFHNAVWRGGTAYA